MEPKKKLCIEVVSGYVHELVKKELEIRKNLQEEQEDKIKEIIECHAMSGSNGFDTKILWVFNEGFNHTDGIATIVLFNKPRYARAGNLHYRKKNWTTGATWGDLKEVWDAVIDDRGKLYALDAVDHKFRLLIGDALNFNGWMYSGTIHKSFMYANPKIFNLGDGVVLAIPMEENEHQYYEFLKPEIEGDQIHLRPEARIDEIFDLEHDPVYLTASGTMAVNLNPRHGSDRTLVVHPK